MSSFFVLQCEVWEYFIIFFAVVRLNLETGEDGPKIKGKQASYPQVHVSFLSTSVSYPPYQVFFLVALAINRGRGKERR